MIRQSFKPGEATPEETNKIGYTLTMVFKKGEHQFIVATHTDIAHIPALCHMVWGSLLPCAKRQICRFKSLIRSNLCS